MEEVEQFCKGLKKQCSEEEYKTLLKVFGLGEQEGNYIEVEGIGKIDFSIADYIKELNSVGLTTIASCSGLLKDHSYWEEPLAGYISFQDTPFTRKVLETATQRIGITYQESETYLKPSLYIRIDKKTDEVKELLWEVLVKELLENAKKTSS